MKPLSSKGRNFSTDNILVKIILLCTQGCDSVKIEQDKRNRLKQNQQNHQPNDTAREKASNS